LVIHESENNTLLLAAYLFTTFNCRLLCFILSPAKVTRLLTVICCNFLLGTCEASRFDSNRPFRFDSKVMGRFENFRIGHACPLLVVVKRLKPLTAFSGTVCRFASSTSDYTPVLSNMFEGWTKNM